MDSNPWEEVIDELYEMGGYGEWCHPEDEGDVPINRGIDLRSRTDQDADKLIDIVDRLESSGLVHEEHLFEPGEMEGNTVSSVAYFGVGLTEDGFSLAHDRRAEKRNHESNRSITILTFVLAVVGLSQATALTVRTDSLIATGVLAGAAVIFFIVYIRLIQQGIIDL